MAKISAAERKKMPNNQFALPGKKMFPMYQDGKLDKNHINLGWDMVSRAKELTAGERETARKNLLAAGKKAGIDTSKWDKKVMSDTIIAQVQVLTDATQAQEGPLKVRFKGTQANVVNTNRRLYPFDVLSDAINVAKEKYVAPGRMIGESPHPVAKKGPDGNIFFDTKIENSVIKISDVFMDGMDVFFDAEILETVKGKDLKALVLQGVPVGASMRFLGQSVKRPIDNVMVDVTTAINISSFDIVMNPATNGCEAVQVLTDSQVGEILDTYPYEDGISFVTPNCPQCGAELEMQDPDEDGDIDFYICPNGHGPFLENSGLSVTTTANTSLSLVTANDYDRYQQAQEYIKNQQVQGKGSGMTDSTEGGAKDLTREEMLELMKSDPEFMGIMSAQAGAIAKPALDAVEAQKVEEAKAQARAEAKVFMDSKVAELKGKLPDNAIKAITDAIEQAAPATKEQAGVLFDATIAVISGANASQALTGMGFNDQAGPEGQVRVEFGESPKPWKPIVDQITAAFDRYGERFGKQFDPKLRESNKKTLEKIMDRHVATIGPKALADSVVDGDLRVYNDSIQGFEMMQDSVSVTTAQLLNQPTILTAVLVQAFQDVESLQFLYADTFDGIEWRIPVETFTGAETPNPATGLMDFVTAEGVGIAESAIGLSWLPFQPTWRNVAVSLSSQVVKEMLSGPAKYDSIARALYHLGEAKKRRIDDAAYLEMLMASDEYAPYVVTNETIPSGELTAVSNSTNVVYTGKLTVATTKTATAEYNPIVRPRQKVQLQTNGSSTVVTINPFTCTVNSVAQVLGYLDSNGNVASFAGTTATFAVDFENGVMYFTAGAGINDTTIFPICSYSAVTNYDVWHYTVPSTTTPEYWYNTFLQQLSNSAALMGSSPRFKVPNLSVMSRNAATYIENAQIFYKLAQPEGTRLITTGNYFGERSGMNLAKINAPWAAGDGRTLLTQKGSTRYGVETPFQMEGPYPKYDSNGLIMDVKVWMGRENSVLCTPQVQNSSGVIINPVSRTVKIVP